MFMKSSLHFINTNNNISPRAKKRLIELSDLIWQRSVSKSLAKTEIDTINLTTQSQERRTSFLPLAHHLANYIFSSSYVPFSLFPLISFPPFAKHRKYVGGEIGQPLLDPLRKKIFEFLRKHHPFPFWNPCLFPKYQVIIKVF